MPGNEIEDSTVIFTIFGLYKKTARGGAVKALQGASSGRVAEDGCVELVADSVPFNAESFSGRAPNAGQGILMLYGKDAVDAVYRWRNHARDVGAEFVSARVEIDVGHLYAGRMERDFLRAADGRIQFLNLTRMKATFQESVRERFAHYIEVAGGDPEREMSSVAHMASRPDLWTRALSEDRDLGALKAMVFPISDDPDDSSRRVMTRQVALVRPGARVVAVHQGRTDARLVLPEWLAARGLNEALRLSPPAPSWQHA